MDASPVLYRTRPQPSWAVLVGFFGLFLLFSTETRIVGLILLAGAALSCWRAEVVLTSRYLKVRRGLLFRTSELQLAKLETIQTWSLLGSAKWMAVVGTGGTVYTLGIIPRAQVFRDKLEEAMDAARVLIPR
jgi:hypothetical protein